MNSQLTKLGVELAKHENDDQARDAFKRSMTSFYNSARSSYLFRRVENRIAMPNNPDRTALREEQNLVRPNGMFTSLKYVLSAELKQTALSNG